MLELVLLHLPFHKAISQRKDSSIQDIILSSLESQYQHMSFCNIKLLVYVIQMKYVSIFFYSRGFVVVSSKMKCVSFIPMRMRTQQTRPCLWAEKEVSVYCVTTEVRYWSSQVERTNESEIAEIFLDQFDLHMSVHRKSNSKLLPRTCNVS